MKRISLFLKARQIAALKKLSQKTGAPFAELIRRAVDAFLKKEHNPPSKIKPEQAAVKGERDAKI